MDLIFKGLFATKSKEAIGERIWGWLWNSPFRTGNRSMSPSQETHQFTVRQEKSSLPCAVEVF